MYFKFFKRKDRDKRFGEGRRRSRQGFFYSRRDGSTPLQVVMRIGIPIESGWYRVIYAPGCAFAPPGAFFGLERRDGRPYPPVPAAAESPPLRRGGKIANGDQGGEENSPSHASHDSPLFIEGAFGHHYKYNKQEYSTKGVCYEIRFCGH